MDQATRLLAQRRFRVFWMLNAIPVAFLLDDILVLYGIRNGLPAPALAAVASFVQLSMPFMLVGRLITARKGLARGWATAYRIRYVLVLILVIVPYLQSNVVRTAVFLAGALAFAMLRAAGVINMHALNGEITSEEDRGRYLHGNFALFNGTYMVAVALTVVATRLVDKIWIYQAMVMVASAVGLLSLRPLVRVPETGVGKRAAQEPFFSLLASVRKEINLLVLIPAWAGGLAAFGMVAPFAIMLIKNGYGIDDYTALFFTLLFLMGSVASGVLNRRLTTRIKPHSLVIAYVALLVGIAAAWAFSPATFVLPVVAGLFFLTGVSKAGIVVGLQHYLISENRPEHRMHVSLLAELSGAAIAGLSGTLLGGGLLQFFGARVQGIEIYHGYFRVVAVLLLVALFFVQRLARSGSAADRAESAA